MTAKTRARNTRKSTRQRQHELWMAMARGQLSTRRAQQLACTLARERDGLLLYIERRLVRELTGEQAAATARLLLRSTPAEQPNAWALAERCQVGRRAADARSLNTQLTQAHGQLRRESVKERHAAWLTA